MRYDNASAARRLCPLMSFWLREQNGKVRHTGAVEAPATPLPELEVGDGVADGEI